MKKIHILENTLRSVLLENRESKNINLARKFLKSHGYDDEQAQKTLDAIRTDMPNARLAQCKFLLGVVRLFLNKELADGNAIMKLNSYLPYIASDAHVNEYDNDLNGMSYDEIAERFRPMYTQDAEKSRKESYGKKRTVNTEYSIVRIPDFETASKYGDYTTWCVTHDDYAYDSYTSEGRGLFYFCLKKGFERVPQDVGEGCPLDEYGLSMIAVSVTDEGEPNTITCRWNHQNGANDHVMSKDDLEDLLGVNFYEAFKPYTEDELLERGLYTVSMLRRWVSEGKDILDICKKSKQITYDLFQINLSPQNMVLYNFHINKLMPSDEFALQNVLRFNEGLAAIQREDGKWSFINTEGQQVGDWHCGVHDFSEGFAAVQRDDDKWSFINKNGQEIGRWYYKVGDFYGGFAAVRRDDGKWSFINTDGQEICGWFVDIGRFYDGLAKVQQEDGKWAIINADGKLICNWYNNIDIFINGFAIVRGDDGKYSFINEQGQEICRWYKNVWAFENGFAKVQREDGKWSYINTEGQQICEWYKGVDIFYNGYARIKRDDGKMTFINTKGQRVFRWFDAVNNFHDGLAFVMLNKHRYYIDYQGNFYDYKTKQPISVQNESYARLNNLITEALYTSVRNYLLYN